MKSKLYDIKLNVEKNKKKYVTFSVIFLCVFVIGIAYFLFTYSLFSDNDVLDIMDNKVGYFSNYEVIFHLGEGTSNIMPEDNCYNEFVSASCNNGGSFKFNEAEWDYEVTEGSDYTTCDAYFRVAPESAACQLVNLANSADETDYFASTADGSQMFVFKHGETEQTPALKDYRYIGGGDSYCEYSYGKSNSYDGTCIPLYSYTKKWNSSGTTLYIKGEKTAPKNDSDYTYTNVTLNQPTGYYIMPQMKNYIEFNCDADGTNCEKWRIIGVFINHDGKRRIKIIKDFDTSTDYNRFTSGIDYKKTGLGSSISNNGSNDWTDAQLMYALNSAFISPTNKELLRDGYDVDSNGVITDQNHKIIYKLGYKPAAISVDDTEYTSTTLFPWTLKDSAKGKIDKVRYYLGNTSAVSNYCRYAGKNGTENCYKYQRSNEVYDAENLTIPHPTYWDGYVGVVDATDVILTFDNNVNTYCFNNYGYTNGSHYPHSSWLAYWACVSNWGEATLSLIGNGYHSFSRDLYSRYPNYGSGGFRPVVFLKDTTKFVPGTDGSESNPYRILSS